jgi:hypothetical protein
LQVALGTAGAGQTFDVRTDKAQLSVAQGSKSIPFIDDDVDGRHGLTARYTAYFERFPPQLIVPEYAEVATTAVDGFEPLSRANLRNIVPEELSGSRVNRILDLVGVPTADREVDAGHTTVAGETLDESALFHLKVVARSESGIIFYDGRGFAVFHDRHRRITDFSPVLATFGDGGGSELPFRKITPDYSADEVRNEITVEMPDPEDPQVTMTHTVSDTPSDDDYWTRSHTVSTVLSTHPESQDLANYLLSRFKDPVARIDSIEISGQGDDRVWEHQLLREISDKIEVMHTPPGDDLALSIDSHIEGIEDDITFGEDGRYVTRWLLSAADPQSYWVLGDPVNSVLGETTKLAY